MPAPVGHDDFIIRPPVFRKRQEIPFEGIFRGFAAFAPDDYPGGTRRGGRRISLRIRIVQGNLLSVTGQPSQHRRLQISVRQTVACRWTDSMRGRCGAGGPTAPQPTLFGFPPPLCLTHFFVRDECIGRSRIKPSLYMSDGPIDPYKGRVYPSPRHLPMGRCRVILNAPRHESGTASPPASFRKNEVECDSNCGFREL